ncbi:carboxypeptidase-like regulatory domain-containing protein [Gillisia limnaea]|uniref:Carboxypeptidase-like protein n=1 Tax=Gillisia limnaea (strain DSM 15749 / LMG 21470 / R-8282) TaxID=865937 RepID=H2BUL0_GILLR|nr:carboxypeptidase-like regulatory domain-containing protein [Gillisia limnaea]EHQ03888.1 hypothetical protein Gilli_3282 [Gillisia limnaea DSM 15749]
MNKNFFLIFLVGLFLCLSTPVLSQSVSGTLKDQNTHKTIPFATVQIGKDYGVITNQEGVFSINISQFTEYDSLFFSNMGYEPKSMRLKDYSEGIVYLQENVNQLDEVVLLDKKLSAREVMERVNQNLYQNYENSLTHFTVFHRSENKNTPGKIKFEIKKADFISEPTLQDFNKSMDSIAKASKGVTTSFYNSYLAEAAINEKDSLKVKLQKATELVNEELSNSMEKLLGNVVRQIGEKLKSSNTFKFRSGIIPLGDSLDLSKSFEKPKDSLTSKYVGSKLKGILKDSIFDASKGLTIAIGGGGSDSGMVFSYVTQTDDYNYHIEDITTFNGEMVYLISFTPDSGFFGGGGKFFGKMYVSANSFAVLKTEYQLAEGKHGSKFNWKLVLGVKFVENEKAGTVIFQQDTNGKYYPKYIQSSGKMYAYANRSFVLKENVKNNKDGIKLKFKFIMEFDNSYNNEYLIVDSRPLSQSGFSTFQHNKGVIIEKTTTYNPEIWKEYNIIAPTEAIRDYKF